MEKIFGIAKERVRDEKLHAVLGHANVPDQAEQLKQTVLSQFHCDELYVVDVSPTTAIHNGQGLIEFGFCTSS